MLQHRGLGCNVTMVKEFKIVQTFHEKKLPKQQLVNM